jgi:hypothetical protein
MTVDERWFRLDPYRTKEKADERLEWQINSVML